MAHKSKLVRGLPFEPSSVFVFFCSYSRVPNPFCVLVTAGAAGFKVREKKITALTFFPFTGFSSFWQTEKWDEDRELGIFAGIN